MRHGKTGTCHGYGRDTDFTESELSNTMRHNTLLILKYPSIIAWTTPA